MKKAIFLFPILLCLLAASCKKTESPISVSTTYDKKGLSALFSVLKQVPQAFTVTAGISQTIIGTDSTAITFYPNSFKDASGNLITSGTINIELTEMYKPGNVIANGTSAISDGYLLRSGGQVLIKATNGGQEVFANVYKISFPQPYPSSQPMALFYGNNKNEDSVITWAITDTGKNGTTANTTMPASTANMYIFDSCTRFGWINCDYFYKTASPVTNINITMPDTSYNPGNTRVFLIFPNINSVCASGFSYVQEYAFFRSMLIPTGLTVNVITITIKGGNYYFSEKNGLTVSSYLTVKPQVTQMTLAELTAKLKSL